MAGRGEIRPSFLVMEVTNVLLSHDVNLQAKPIHLFVHKQAAAEPYEKSHAHPGMELLFIVQGQGQIIVDRQAYAIAPGMLLCFQPYQHHHLIIEASEERKYERYILIFDPLAADRYLNGFPRLQRFFRHLWQGKLASPVFDTNPQSNVLVALYEQIKADWRRLVDQEHPERGMAFLLTLLQWLESLRRREGPEGWLRHSGRPMKPRKL